jgi:hypothetical protein
MLRHELARRLRSTALISVLTLKGSSATPMMR